MSNEKRLLDDRPFVIHLVVYIMVNLLLAVIDLTTSPGHYWFYWPLLGWGIGILGHAYLVHAQSQRRSRPS